MELKLPQTIISRIDVARVMREIETLNDFLVGAKVRKTGQPMQLPRLSRQLEDLARDNERNLLEESQRKEVLGKLNQIIGSAPSIHISFAAEPNIKAINRILLWFRESVDPQVLIQVGLQPNIAVGCVVRSPNILFDLSMRQYLAQQEPYLTQLLKETARVADKTVMGSTATEATPVEGIALDKVKEVEPVALPVVPEKLITPLPAKAEPNIAVEEAAPIKVAPVPVEVAAAPNNAPEPPAPAPVAAAETAPVAAPPSPMPKIVAAPPAVPAAPAPQSTTAAPTQDATPQVLAPVPLPLAAEAPPEKTEANENTPVAAPASSNEPVIGVATLAPVPLPIAPEPEAEPEGEHAG